MTEEQAERVIAALESIALALHRMDAYEPQPEPAKPAWPWPSMFFGGGMFG